MPLKIFFRYGKQDRRARKKFVVDSISNPDTSPTAALLQVTAVRSGISAVCGPFKQTSLWKNGRGQRCPQSALALGRHPKRARNRFEGALVGQHGIRQP